MMKKDRSDNTAELLREPRRTAEVLSPDEARKRIATMTRRSFLTVGAAAVFGIFGWRWMSEETKYSLLRKTLEFNEKLSRAAFSNDRLAREFSNDDITPARVNGDLGMKSEIDMANWRLRIEDSNSHRIAEVSIDEIRAMPRTEMIIEFKCIEGWSTITHFAGVRFSELVNSLGIQSSLAEYTALETPDSEYYVGWDTESIMHPQTLLAYEINGIPLSLGHGAPLRLASPAKYGIKQIKRIGVIRFTAARPRDYWAEQGYDWYAGL